MRKLVRTAHIQTCDLPGHRAANVRGCETVQNPRTDGRKEMYVFVERIYPVSGRKGSTCREEGRYAFAQMRAHSYLEIWREELRNTTGIHRTLVPRCACVSKVYIPKKSACGLLGSSPRPIRTPLKSHSHSVEKRLGRVTGSLSLVRSCRIS